MVTEKITSYDKHNFLYPLCENLAKKCELAVLNENGLFNMKLGAYINSNTLNANVNLSCFRRETFFFGKFCLKNQNCLK